MRILMINVCCGVKSTGRICTDLAKALINKGHDVRIAYARDIVPDEYKSISIRIGTKFDVYKQAMLARVFDNEGFGNRNSTNNFINWIKIYKPDIIHLHNIHGYYVNCELLFSFLKEYGVPVVWTLHDCWSFTGHCAYFDYIGCHKWLSCCKQCPQKSAYPSSYVLDNSCTNYLRKKSAFTGLEDLTIVTPSKWLARLVSQSFLKDNRIIVIPNGINTDIFKSHANTIRTKHGIGKKIMILGVAAIWNDRKGLKIFHELSYMLNNNYIIVLIGLTKKQIASLPKNIIGIEFTNGVQELADYYSAADYFVNPTFEDNYPTTNIEAIACGTPVITFNTGGSGESASMYGYVTKEKSAASIYEIIAKNLIPEKEININLLSIDMFVKRYMNIYKCYSKRH